ncbi:patatin [Granulicella sp. WH15]|nr:patatin [Granulicella sp. WH15]
MDSPDAKASSQPSQSLPAAETNAMKGKATQGKAGAQGDTAKSTTNSSSGERLAASGRQTSKSPLDPSVAPVNNTGRPRIGLALGGGGALGLSEVGVLQWFEEHHVPVDVIAGTSMGCMVSALYSSGKTVEQLKVVMNDSVFNSVFSFGADYKSRSFRRREDSRELPNAVTVGLRKRISFRNSLLTDQGLNAFLDRQFFRYDDQIDFNDLPIPLRCLSTDLNEARTVTFARGSIPNAIRASVSLPVIYRPFEMDGHQYVDGGVLENLPARTVKDMNADVVLAVSLPISPVAPGDLGSIFGVLQRSFSVAIEGAERQQRKLADVVIMPDLKGFSATDYLKTVELSKQGYAAAEEHKSELLKYALNDAQWAEYLAQRQSKRRGPAGPVLSVKVDAPNDSATRAVQRLFAPMVNKPVDTAKIEAMLDEIRSDGRYDADYAVGYYTAAQSAALGRKLAANGDMAPAVALDVKTGQAVDGKGLEVAPGTSGPVAPDQSAATPEQLAEISARPVLLVKVTDKSTGPPFLQLGLNIEAQTTAVTRATLEGRLIQQDLGGYGDELRTIIRLGYQTELNSEYYRPIQLISAPSSQFFYAPHADLLRQPFSIYTNQVRLADRQLQRLGVGADVGWGNARNQELRAGFEYNYVDWQLQVGDDHQPSYTGGSQRARLRYIYDTQDRNLVPQFGIHLVSEASYLYEAVGSRNAPQLYGQGSFAHALGKRKDSKNLLIFAGEGGTMFHRDVAQPFRYTLGGPLRLSASAIDEYRGTDYWLVEPAILRRIAKMPSPLGQSIYVGAGYEYGQIFAPGTDAIHRQDVYFGIVAETPLGVITLAPTFGDADHRKFVFTLGKLF